MGDVQVNLDFQKSSKGLLWALVEVHQKKATGLLAVSWPDEGGKEIRKDIAFENGDPIAIMCLTPSEGLGAFLIRKGKIDQASIDAALEKRDEENSEDLLGEYLVSEGLIAESEISKLLVEHFSERLVNSLTLLKGDVKFLPIGELPPRAKQMATEDMLTKPYMKLLWDGVKQHYSDEYCAHRLRSWSGKKVKLKGAFPFNLTGADREFAESLKAQGTAIDGQALVQKQILTVASEFNLLVEA